MKFTDRLRALIQSAENGLSAPAEKALMEFMSDHAKEILALVEAAKNMRDCKGRYHTEQSTKRVFDALAALPK